MLRVRCVLDHILLRLLSRSMKWKVKRILTRWQVSGLFPFVFSVLLQGIQDINKALWIAFVKAYNTAPISLPFTLMTCITAMRFGVTYELDFSLTPKYQYDEATHCLSWNAAGRLPMRYRKPKRVQVKDGYFGPCTFGCLLHCT